MKSSQKVSRREPDMTASKALSLDAVYIVELRQHALAIVWLGYRRMNANAFAKSEEDTITGELVKEMKQAIEADNAPEWTEHYSVSEQVRANTEGKMGKY